MKLAITAMGNGWNEAIDDRFGRAKGFFVCDTENDDTSYIDNSKNIDAAHGAGTSTAQAVVDLGVEAVITVKVGPKAGSVLKAGGVKVFVCGGAPTIKDAYDRFRNGELQEESL